MDWEFTRNRALTVIGLLVNVYVRNVEVEKRRWIENEK